MVSNKLFGTNGLAVVVEIIGCESLLFFELRTTPNVTKTRPIVIIENTMIITKNIVCKCLLFVAIAVLSIHIIGRKK